MASLIHRGDGRAAGAQGYALVVLLVLLAVLAWGASVTGPLWSEAARRDKEDELLKVGAMYAAAIEQYYRASPGSTKAYPDRLEDLLLDHRFVGTKRYMRRLYADPLTGKLDWGELRNGQNQLVGVFSRSQDVPVRQGAVAMGLGGLGSMRLQPARVYSDWKFSYGVGQHEKQP